MNRRRIITIIVVVFVALALVGVRRKRVYEKNHAPLMQRIPPTVQVVPVRVDTIESLHHVLGVVRGAEEAELAPRIVGTVEEVLVREGEKVQKGQVLARLDPRELQDAVSQGEANVEASRVSQVAQSAATARDKTLFENEAISQEQWERSQAADAAAAARLRVARKQLDQAQARLAYCVLRAPFNGVVSARLSDPGDLAMPGHPLLRIVQQRTVRVRARISPEIAAAVRIGMPVDLTLSDEKLRSEIARVFPAMEGDHLGTIEVDVARPPLGFVTGATVGVDLHLQGGSGLVIPLDALLEGDNGTSVFVVSQDDNGPSLHVHAVSVKVTTRSLDEALVEGNLSEGARVVVARPSRLMNLTDNMDVSLEKENESR